MTVSPLAEIERRVQARARRQGLDPADSDGEAALRALVDEEVAAWSAAFRRGRRPVDLADPSLVADRAHRNLVSYGPLTRLLEDDDVWEIMVNAPDAVFVRRHRGRSGYHDEVFHDDDHVVRTLTKVLDDAAVSHRKLDPAEGLQDAQLEDGSRIHVVHRDLSRGGHVLANIRRFTGVAFHDLDQLVDQAMLPGPVAAFLVAAMRSRLTTVIAGPPGSGKTTLLSCCTAHLDPALRVVVAEEVFEVDVPLPNVASMQTRPPRPDRPGVDLRQLVSGFLRMAPDVAVVGEVRDREALPLLLTLSSGVTGYTTIHAGSARRALTRLRFLCQLADTSSDLPVVTLNHLVSESIDLVVHCRRGPDGPLVTEVVAVEDAAGPSDSIQFTVTPLFEPTESGHLAWTGNLPVRAAIALENAGFDGRALLSGAGRA